MAINKKLLNMSLGAFLALGLGTVIYTYDDLNEDILLYTSLDGATTIQKPTVGSPGVVTNVSYTTGKVKSGAYMVCDSTCLSNGTKRVISFPVKNNINLDQGEIIFWYKPNYDANVDDKRHTLLSVSLDGYNPPMMLLEESDRLSLRITDSNWHTYSTAAVYQAPLWKKNEWVIIRIRWDNKSPSDSLVIFVGEGRVDNKTGTGGWDIKNINQDLAKIYLGGLNSDGHYLAQGAIDEFIIRAPMAPMVTQDAGVVVDSGINDSGIKDSGIVFVGDATTGLPDATTVDSGLKDSGVIASDSGTQPVDSGTALLLDGGGIFEPSHPTGNFGYNPPGASVAANVPYLSKPNIGQRIQDPTFKTTVRRVSGISVPIYSQLQAFTTDMKYMMTIIPGGGIEIRSYPDLNIVPTNVTGSAPKWIPGTHKILTLEGLPVRFLTYDVDLGGSQSTELMRLPEYYTASGARSWEEMSRDGRWTGLFARKQDGSRYFMAVDIVNKRISGALINLESFCGSDPQWGYIEPDWVAVSPLGNYLVIQWLGNNQCSGLRTYNLNTGAFVAKLYDHHNHSDRGIDSDGREIMMTSEAAHPDNNNYPSIAIHYMNGDGTKHLRMVYWGATDHFSCTGPRGMCVVTSGGILLGPELAPFERELWLQYTDGHAKRMVHHRSTSCEYWVMPKASWSVDGSTIIYSSDYENCTDPQNGTHGSAYIIEGVNP